MNTDAPIAIQGLNHYFGQNQLRKQALFNINLEIQRGEIIIMTGPSGSGKTTILTLIGGLRSAQEGSLKVLGRELCGANEKQLIQTRRSIGFIFQAHNLLNSLTAQQNVQMAIDLQENSVEEQAETKILTAVGLGDRLNYYPENLSGGQKQRVAIARALVTQPQIILADEPTAALDSKSGRDVVQLLQHLAKEQGCTILLVTHDNRILDIADHIIHMEDGKLGASDTVAGYVASHDPKSLDRRMFTESKSGG
ncbi:MAG: DevA family ABC transporter ATP-binding protein [Gemmatimonadaceae bacterium]|nr:DevA family ABC transporter ATP-binding protein [Gloeobacterales cyanobacterium ES-bin-141]